MLLKPIITWIVKRCCYILLRLTHLQYGGWLTLKYIDLFLQFIVAHIQIYRLLWRKQPCNHSAFGRRGRAINEISLYKHVIQITHMLDGKLNQFIILPYYGVARPQVCFSWRDKLGLEMVVCFTKSKGQNFLVMLCM